MKSSPLRVWFGLAALAAVSIAGDRICLHQATGGAEGERLLEIASRNIDALPETIGPWRMTASQPLDENAARMLQCRAHLSRSYRNDDTGESVSLMMLVGRAGPLLAHTPEVCYSSQSFETLEAAHPQVIRKNEADEDVFSSVLFASTTVGGEKQRVYYGWRPFVGHWVAPKNPRLALGGEPILYKLQVDAQELAPANEKAPVADSIQRFLDDLLPALDRNLGGR